MDDLNEFIARKYNEKYNYKEIQEFVVDEFGQELSIGSLRKRVHRMKSNGTLDYLFEDTAATDDVNILDEIEQRSGGFLRTGVLDCETTGLYADFGYILVAVIKDFDTGKHQVFRLDECRNYKNIKARKTPEFWRRIDIEILQNIRKAYEQYDLIIHYNGRNFDIKFLNTRLLKNNLPVLPDMKQLDVYQLAKSKLRLLSKRLDALKEFLEIDKDEDGHRWEYWSMAANGQQAGFDHVVRHCIKDTDRLAEVARRMRVFVNYIRK